MSETFGGTIGYTVADSTPWWPAPRTTSRTNVVMVVLDDTGSADFGCYGSEIATPTFDRLADGGVRFSAFHVTPMCSPTRACLLTGRNHHRVGMRFLAHVDTGYPSGRGRITRRAALLSELLQLEGYGTFMVGKWHLAPRSDTTAGGPFGDWPLARGFDRFYGFLDGCTDQFHPELVADNHSIDPPRHEGYHLTEDLVNEAISMVTDHTVMAGDRPFYLQLALGATHAPFQVHRPFIDRYDGTYARGWDAIREERLARQIELGIYPHGTQLAERNEGVVPWTSLPDAERRLYARLMAAYAGFLEHADREVGRLITHLEQLGLLDDTLVIVVSDNGASYEGGLSGAVDVAAPYSGHQQSVEEMLSRIEDIGGPHGPSHYPAGWAMACNTPLRRYKQFVDAGGVRAPLIMRLPGRVSPPGSIRHQFVHAVDVMPTILDVLAVDPPEQLNGVEQLSLDGASIVPLIADPSHPPIRSTQYFELLGHRAIWHEGWKAVAMHVAGTPYESDQWRLYHLDVDPAEIHDLAEAEPARLAQLRALWEREAVVNDVLPLDDRAVRAMLSESTPGSFLNRGNHRFLPGQSHLSSHSGLCHADHAFEVMATLHITVGDESGAIIANGGPTGGYVLYLDDGVPVFEHLSLGRRSVIRAGEQLAPGDHCVGVRLTPDGPDAGTLVLLVDDGIIGKETVPLVHRFHFWGIDVGADRGGPVSIDYADRSPFALGPGVLAHVDLRLDPSPAGPELDELAE